MKKYSLPNFLLKNIKVIPHVNYPPRIIIPLRQGSAHDAQLLVSQGTKVMRGQVIAKGNKNGSQNHHSSIGGVVNRIKNFHYPGEFSDIKSIEIKIGGKFSTYMEPTKSLDEQITNKELFRTIREAGIYDYDVGIVDQYLQQKQKIKPITHIVINAIELSPFLLLEEKILQMHTPEIAIALKYVHQLFNEDTSSDENNKIVINSNYFSNRKGLSKLLKARYGFSAQTLSMNKFDDPDGLFRKSTLNQSDYFNEIVRYQLDKHLGNLKENIINVQDNAVILRPSSLLAIYEAIILGKQYIDSYIQIINGIDEIYLQRVPLGTPVLYLLSTFNQHWKEFPGHCFVGEFGDRKMLLSFATPVMKNNLHFWLLTDEKFTIFYKRLQAWLTDA